MLNASKVRLKFMIESEKLSYITIICNLYPFVAAVMLLGVFMSDIAPAKKKHHLYPFVGINTAECIPF